MSKFNNAAALLEPRGISRVRDGRALRTRYGRSGVPVWRLPVLAEECRLDLVPARVNVYGGLVVDLGANVGAWSGAFLAVAPRARVLAVEPAPEPLSQLTERFAGDGRVEIAPVAVSDRSGTATFHVTEHSHNSSLQAPLDMDSEYGHGWAEKDTIEVPVTTLDELVGDRAVSVLKIDVQGAESKVIAGGAGVLSRAEAVLIEVCLRSHYQDDLLFADLHPLMESHGYQVAGWSSPRFGQSGDALWLDACYVRAE